MAKITYDDKVGIEPKTVAINQWQDIDGNLVKNVINKNDDISGESKNRNDVSFAQVSGSYINSPLFPLQTIPIPINLTDAIGGGFSTIWYKGAVLSKSDFTGGIVVIFAGVNILDELCRIFIDYDKLSGAFTVSIQTGFTGDLPPPTILSAPTNLSVVNGTITATTFIISFTLSPNATSYLVLRNGSLTGQEIAGSEEMITGLPPASTQNISLIARALGYLDSNNSSSVFVATIGGETLATITVTDPQVIETLATIIVTDPIETLATITVT